MGGRIRAGDPGENIQQRDDGMRTSLLNTWLGVAFLVAGFLACADVVILSYHFVFGWSLYCAAAGLFALVMLINLMYPQARQRRYWWGFGLAVGGGCVGYILSHSYATNQRTFFLLGLAGALVLLVLAKAVMVRRAGIHLAMNTLLLLILALPAADAIRAPDRAVSERPLEKKVYSFEAARQDPITFALWWEHFVRQWSKVQKKILMPDPKGELPFRLKPNSMATFFESEFRINSLGFRDEEFPREKGDVYRIVALGESTTMGHTMEAEDNPWPKVLEGYIRDRLSLDRPVQVINAGVAAYSLQDNVNRLEDDILSLEPDMIISYHGYNGFPMIDDTLAPVRQDPPPDFVDRPLYLIAQCEYRLRMLHYRRRWAGGGTRVTIRAGGEEAALATPYAQTYRRLIQMADREGIELALASYNMSVTAESEPEVIAFYRGAFPNVDSAIQCNIVHNRMIEDLARAHPRCWYVDTSGGLNGCHDQYIDLVHFTQEGRERLAENIYAGIVDRLRRDLEKSRFPADDGAG